MQVFSSAYFLIFSLLFFISTSLLSASENSFNIVIDPGHGGLDRGAVRDSYIESEIVLEISKKVKALLDQQKNITATLTRNNKTGLSLKNRVIFANQLKADLFISLHANTSNSEYVQGMEFYFNSHSPKLLSEAPNLKKLPDIKINPPTSLQVIDKIKNDFLYYDKTEKSLMLSNAFKEKTTEQDQKSIIKRAPFYVIDHTNMPSILIELGFISNHQEAKKLMSKEYQNEMARLLTSAILKYKEKSDKLKAL